MKKFLVWGALMLAVSLFTGCSSTGTKDDDSMAGADVQERGMAGDASTSGAQGSGSWSGSALEDPNSPLYAKVIYFDFDQYQIRSEFIPTLRAHAAYLNANSQVSLTIEGHCDERGSREYNIGLGERRANAVQRFLEAEGVSGSQLNTLSYGEERPDELGHNEAAWAKNRRALLSY